MRPITVLVVDDMPAVLGATERMLLREGYAVRTAGTAAAALAACADGAVDVLVTDTVLPGMTGIDLAALAVDRRPELKTVFVSGYVDRFEYPPDAVKLAKPFDAVTLAAAVRRAVDA